MKVMSSFCVAVFVAILLLSICETISGSYYITNVAKSVIFPLFLMSIEDSIYRIYEKAQDILSNMRYEHLAEFKEAKSMHCVFKNFKSEEDIVLKQKNGWGNKFERESQDINIIDRCMKSLDKWFSWHYPIYTIILVLIIVSIIFAQTNELKSISEIINSDSITLWTFTLILFNIAFTDKLANVLIKLALKRNSNSSLDDNQR